MRGYMDLVVGKKFHGEILGMGRRALHRRDFRLARSVSRLLAVAQGDCANRACNACPLAPDCSGARPEPADEGAFWGAFRVYLEAGRAGPTPRQSAAKQ